MAIQPSFSLMYVSCVFLHAPLHGIVRCMSHSFKRHQYQQVLHHLTWWIGMLLSEHLLGFAPMRSGQCVNVCVCVILYAFGFYQTLSACFRDSFAIWAKWSNVIMVWKTLRHILSSLGDITQFLRLFEYKFYMLNNHADIFLSSFLFFRRVTSRVWTPRWTRWRSFVRLWDATPRRSESSSTTTATGCHGPLSMERSGSLIRYAHKQRICSHIHIQ